MEKILGKITVYRVNKTVGYIRNFLGEYEEVDLSKIEQEHIKYIDIVDSEGQKKYAIRDGKALYAYCDGKLQEQDVMEEGTEIVQANACSLQYFQSNWYKKQFAFDCLLQEWQEGSHQPLSGLQVLQGRMEILTHCFLQGKQQVAAGDILQYRGKYWTVEEVRNSYCYAPKESKSVTIVMKELYKCSTITA